MRYKLNKWLGTILAICLLMSCGMVREGNRTKNSASTTTIVTVDTLAPALQRKYNLFFSGSSTDENAAEIRCSLRPVTTLSTYPPQCSFSTVRIIAVLHGLETG